MPDPQPVMVGEFIDPIAYREDPPCESPEAGALWGLYHALYFAPNPIELFENLPQSVIQAYMRVQQIARPRPRSVPDV